LNSHMTEKLLLAFYIIMEADIVDENIHKICYYCFRLLEKMSYYSMKDKRKSQKEEQWHAVRNRLRPSQCTA
jgi:hypothetical protein